MQKKYQVIMVELSVLVEGDENELVETLRKKAFTGPLPDIFSEQSKGMPVYHGKGYWLVPMTDTKIGEPVEAYSSKEAIKMVCKATGLFPYNLTAYKVD